MQTREPRRLVTREATLVFGPTEKIDCRICNVSDSGALLAVPYDEWLPPRFELVERSGLRRQVALIWQGSEHIGVRFIDKERRQRAREFGRRGSQGT